MEWLSIENDNFCWQIQTLILKPQGLEPRLRLQHEAHDWRWLSTSDTLRDHEGEHHVPQQPHWHGLFIGIQWKFDDFDGINWDLQWDSNPFTLRSSKFIKHGWEIPELNGGFAWDQTKWGDCPRLLEGRSVTSSGSPGHQWLWHEVSIWYRHISSLFQWEFQDPKMEVLYHIRPYFVGIFPYIGLT